MESIDLIYLRHPHPPKIISQCSEKLRKKIERSINKKPFKLDKKIRRKTKNCCCTQLSSLMRSTENIEIDKNLQILARNYERKPKRSINKKPPNILRTEKENQKMHSTS